MAKEIKQQKVEKYDDIKEVVDSNPGKLGEVKAEPVKPASEVDELKKQLEELKKELAYHTGIVRK